MGEVSQKFAADVAVIGENIDKLYEENRQMRRLLSQVALFVAMQPENTFRRKWLAEVDGILNG